MMLKHVFLILSITLMNFGFANAEEPASVSQQPGKDEPIIEDEIPANALISEIDKMLQHDIVPLYIDTCYNDSVNVNLSFQYNDLPDSTDFSVIEYYFKYIMPAIKNVDLKRYVLIEIL